MFFPQIELVKNKKSTSELRIVYKVVSHNMKSLVMTGDKEIEYTFEAQVKPISGYIHTFNNYENAKVHVILDRKILRCVGRVVTDKEELSAYITSLGDDIVTFGLPRGTLLCRWVFPIEEVNEE